MSHALYCGPKWDLVREDDNAAGIQAAEGAQNVRSEVNASFYFLQRTQGE